ncbi:MAG TPA: hypothetical protein V6C89_05990 [Drouetiella sp.]|jgi:hypothetical protein
MLALRASKAFFLVGMPLVYWLAFLVPTASAMEESQARNQTVHDYQGGGARQVQTEQEQFWHAEVIKKQVDIAPDADLMPDTREVEQGKEAQIKDGLGLTSGLPIKYWGNSFSLKFHRPSCPFAKAMSAHHVMFFNFRKQAVDLGQLPCRYCLPPDWTSVRAAIWHPAEPSVKSQTP